MALPTPRRGLRSLLALLACGTCIGAAHAQAAQDTIRGFIEREAAGSTRGLRFEITVGQLDSRLTLAPCGRIEPFLPSNARLWGRTQIGVRCLEGASWSVWLPVTVRVWGQALVATRPLLPNQPLAADDVALAEVELTREAQGVVTDPLHLDNKVLARQIAPGQPIPVAALRAPMVIGSGETVKIVGIGRGFTVSASGQALAAAGDGQPVRVRTDTGKVVTGTARAGRVVEVAL